MKMQEKLKYSMVLCLCIFSVSLAAQRSTNHLEVGLNLSQYQQDFGIGVHLVSPYWAGGSVAVKVGVNLQWLEHLDGTETVWTPYQNVQLGVRGRNTIVEDKIFIYGEGGIVAIFPNDTFSEERIVVGGYGLFGFEFKTFSKFAYFIELGGLGSGATADAIPNAPIYSNGFLTQVGFRIGL